MIVKFIALFITISLINTVDLPITCEQAIVAFRLKYKCISQRRENLGKGANGITFLIEKKEDASKFILKVSKLRSKDPKDNKSLIYLNKLKDVKYIVKRHKDMTSGKLYFEILDYGEKGSLDRYLSHIDTMNDQRGMLRLFGKIVEGIHEMHKRNVIHADIKQENVVVDSELNPLIIDFDLSVENGYRSGGRGTLEYLDPVILQNWGTIQTTFTPDRDKWSLGVLLYYMIFKNSPFKNSLPNYEKKEVLAFVRQGELFFPRHTSFPIMKVITSLLCLDEENRIDLGELLTLINVFLAKPNWAYLEDALIFNINDTFPETIKELVEGDLEENHAHLISTIFFLFFLILVVPVLVIIWYYSTRSKIDFSSQNIISGNDEDTTDNDGPIHEFKC